MKSSFNVGFERPKPDRKNNPMVFIAGDNYYVAQNLTPVDVASSSPSEVRKYKLLRSGSIRLSYILKTASTSATAISQILVNGIQVGTNNSTNSTGGVKFTRDIMVNVNDVLTITLNTGIAGTAVTISDVNIKIQNDIALVTQML